MVYKMLKVVLCTASFMLVTSMVQAQTSRHVNMEVATKEVFTPYYVQQAFLQINGVFECCSWSTGEWRTVDGAVHRNMTLRYIIGQSDPASISATFSRRTGGRYWVERIW